MNQSLIRALVGAVIAFLALPALPVGAQREISTSLSGVSAGSTVTGSVGLNAEASATTGVRRIELSIGGVVVARRSFDDLRTEVSMSYLWDSQYYPASSSLGPNREYVLRVEAVANNGATNSTSRRVWVDNPPNAPAGVAAQNSSGRIVVEWDPNPEPDIVAYRIQRDSRRGFRAVGEVSGTQFSERAGPGTYTYRAIALRSSSTSSDPLRSSPSEPASTTVADGGSRRAGGAVGLRLGAAPPRFGSIGLPSGLALPGRRGPGDAPSSASGRLEGGTYSDTLPYDLEGAYGVDATRPPGRVIPPDGLRWVAAGLLLVAASGLLRMLALRLERVLPGSSNDGAQAQ